MSLQDDDETTKFKLKGTVCTNGLTLNLLAYDTTQQKRKPKSKSTDDEDETDLSEELELDDGFLETTAAKQEGEELTENDYANINWKRGLKTW
ncbi:hypothetical protein BGZ65_001264, partial [Modicella reniformis]